MIGTIQYNPYPYRLVGVFATARKREIISNITQIKANLRVNRQVSFRSDLEEIISPCERTAENINEAESELTLPKDNVYYAQFWFIESTEIDKIAINHLAIGAVEKAISFWEKQNNLSSIHNRVILYLIQQEWGKALELASRFYSSYAKDFIELILGNENQIVAPESLHIEFLDKLCDEIGAEVIIQFISNEEWKEYVSDKITTRLTDSLEKSIALCKKSRGKGPQVRLKAGTKLMTDTFDQIKKLKNDASSSNSTYQIIADKLGLEILQCGIDYYNGSEDADAIFKALKLQKYAQSIVANRIAKERCDENVRILEETIAQLPPIEVIANDKAIRLELESFSSKPELIKHSIELIQKCAPHVLNIKEKLGVKNDYYLRISTLIVNSALSYVISEVNESQEKDFEVLKATLISAWRTQLYMDKFDLEPEYKSGRFAECRLALRKIINDTKGFEDKRNCYKYRYGCGWCNDLDVSDVNLTTDDETFRTCVSLESYQRYLKRFPWGKHAAEAKSKIMKLRYKRCSTLSDYQKFVADFPNSEYATKALESIRILQQIEEAKRKREERQAKAISECLTLNDVLSLYEKEKIDSIDVNKCSNKAYELAKTEKDYQTILSTFDSNSEGVKKARLKIAEIKKIREEKAANRAKILKWALGIGVTIIIFIVSYIFGDIRGLSVAFIAATVTYGLVGFVYLISSGKGCAPLTLLAVGVFLFGFIGSKLNQQANAIDDEKKSKELYEEIVASPTEQACSNYINNYENVNQDYTDKVRDIWLNLLVEESHKFDYNSYDGCSSGLQQMKTPIQKLQEFIYETYDQEYKNKANSYIQEICDSLYRFANRKSTIAAWKQYQRVVPTDFFRDSDAKIENIENRAWNTESKAWQKASSENTIAAYEKYKSLYPRGAHIAICEKRLIDLEVSHIFAGDHGTLPAMDRIGYGGGSTSNIEVKNSTSYTLTLLYSGPDSKRIIIKAGGVTSFKLKNGDYRVAASVSATNVGRYAGSENLSGGSYSVEYYISTYRY